MNEQWEPGTVYLMHSDKDGSGYTAEHTCWNRSRFIANAAAAADKEGGAVDVITREQYLVTRRRSAP